MSRAGGGPAGGHGAAPPGAWPSRRWRGTIRGSTSGGREEWVALATAPWDDDRLLEDLRAALRRAGGPTPVTAATGEAAFTWRTVDAELAVLAEEPAAAGPPPLRGAPPGPRTLAFRGTRLSVELEATGTGLVGQLVPPTTGEVVLQGCGGDLGRARADELGCFTLDHPPGDLVRMRCETPAGGLVTEWFRS